MKWSRFRLCRDVTVALMRFLPDAEQAQQALQVLNGFSKED
ncbi:hypothetical protein ACTMU2_14290 [Cupriavidus basilensis]